LLGEFCNPEVEHFHVAVRPSMMFSGLMSRWINSGLVMGVQASALATWDREVDSFT
jgi:hypothetical protein